MMSSTIMPQMENSTEDFMSSTRSEEWDYNKRSLTTAKIIFITAFGECLKID